MRSPGGKSASRQRGTGFVRIIGGDWRGSKLPVADAPGLRPTGDRARETLFNWLQPVLPGTRCADLFAGTGALGFEAASRGAKEVFLVEKSRALADSLRRTAEKLGAGQVKVVESGALAWLDSGPAGSLDLVFVDPPFDTDLAARALERLGQEGRLAKEATVYLESSASSQAAATVGFIPIREKILGDVRLQLMRWQGDC
jgi:16S rRNA (guanine966-N2)-methyltransferase